jgi:hypothetical protein
MFNVLECSRRVAILRPRRLSVRRFDILVIDPQEYNLECSRTFEGGRVAVLRPRRLSVRRSNVRVNNPQVLILECSGTFEGGRGSASFLMLTSAPPRRARVGHVYSGRDSGRDLDVRHIQREVCVPVETLSPKP